MKLGTFCPVCGVDIEMHFDIKGDSIFKWITCNEDRQTMLLKSLLNYWRWISEGKKTFGEQQYYYDGYHNHINYLPEIDMYEFNIQMSDSPTGDSWMKGKFKYYCWVKEGIERHIEVIHIVESESYVL